jgi:hypothetical protein
MDVDRAVTDLKRVAKKGLKVVMLTPWPANGKAYGDTYYDTFSAVAQEYGLPVGLHVIARPNYHGSQWYQNPTFKGSSFYYLSVTLSPAFSSSQQIPHSSRVRLDTPSAGARYAAEAGGKTAPTDRDGAQGGNSPAWGSRKILTSDG